MIDVRLIDVVLCICLLSYFALNVIRQTLITELGTVGRNIRDGLVKRTLKKFY